MASKSDEEEADEDDGEDDKDEEDEEEDELSSATSASALLREMKSEIPAACSCAIAAAMASRTSRLSDMRGTMAHGSGARGAPSWTGEETSAGGQRSLWCAGRHLGGSSFTKKQNKPSVTTTCGNVGLEAGLRMLK
jgi:hypothetical protein